MKKIAIPTRNEMVDAHFGHCDSYSIFTIDENNEVSNKEMYPAPQGCGCKSNIASLLVAKGVSLMLAGNMGMGAVSVLQSSGIEVLRGCEGAVNNVVKTYLNGKLNDSGESCTHHEQHQNGGDHQCNHN